MTSTHGYRLILRLLNVPDQSARWDPGGWTSIERAGDVGRSLVVTGLIRSLLFAFHINLGQRPLAGMCSSYTFLSYLSSSRSKTVEKGLAMQRLQPLEDH